MRFGYTLNLSFGHTRYAVTCDVTRNPMPLTCDGSRLEISIYLFRRKDFYPERFRFVYIDLCSRVCRHVCFPAFLKL